MKSTERHQLKQDRFVMTLRDTYVRVERHRRYITMALTAVVVVLVAAGGYVWWQQRQDARASALLGEALVVAGTPVASQGDPESGPDSAAAAGHASERARLEAALPKFIAAAEAYPRTQSGLAARYHAAATLVALGRHDEAAARYQEVIDMAGRDVYGRVARLGLAEVNVRQGEYEPAIRAYTELSLDAKGELPVDGILMQLGRTYQLAGRTPEAVQAFRRITEEFPASPYAAEARREVEALEPGA